MCSHRTELAALDTLSLGWFLLLFGLGLVFYRLPIDQVSATSALLSALFVVSGLQLLLFAMWFDMEDNRYLCVQSEP